MEEKNELEMMQRHSMAHVLAKALTKMYNGLKLTIGPAIATIISSLPAFRL